MRFYLSPSSGVPIYKQIAKQVKQAASGGLLTEGDRLPSVRELAEKLTINPNTVIKAYQELERKGIIKIVHGVGTFVTGGISPATEEEKERAIKGYINQLFTEAYHLGLSREKLKELFFQAYQEAGESKKE